MGSVLPATNDRRVMLEESPAPPSSSLHVKESVCENILPDQFSLLDPDNSTRSLCRELGRRGVRPSLNYEAHTAEYKAAGLVPYEFDEAGRMWLLLQVKNCTHEFSLIKQARMCTPAHVLCLSA